MKITYSKMLEYLEMVCNYNPEKDGACYVMATVNDPDCGYYDLDLEVCRRYIESYDYHHLDVYVNGILVLSRACHDFRAWGIFALRDVIESANKMQKAMKVQFVGVEA